MASCTLDPVFLTYPREVFSVVSRDVDEDVILAYLWRWCHQWTNQSLNSIRDEYDRSLLEVAGGYGKHLVVQVLLGLDGSSEGECRFSGLHRSLYHGEIRTASLFELTDKADSEGYIPLDILATNANITLKFRATLFAWGSNRNYSLGLGSKETNVNPEAHDFYFKKKIVPSKFILSDFHSGVLDEDGRMFLAGYGEGGRLGRAESLLQPKEFFNSNSVKDFDLGKDHSIFLVDDNVFLLGKNDFKQLGRKRQECALEPEQLVFPQPLDSSILGVSASTYHSCSWSKNALFVWGLNNGQMGLQKDENFEYLNSPRKVNSLSPKIDIKKVISSEGTIVILTENDSLYVLTDYKTRKLNSFSFPIKDIRIYDKYCHKSGKIVKPLKIFILTTVGILYAWSYVTGTFKCILKSTKGLKLQANAVCISDKDIYIASKYNMFLYTASLDCIFKEEVINKKSCLVKLSRIPRVHCVFNVECDPKGQNLLINCGLSYNEKIFDIVPYKPIEIDEEFCDAEIIVKTKRFLVHTVIIYRENPTLAKKILSTPDRVFHLEDLNEYADAEALFGKMLKHCYASEDFTPKSLNSLGKKLGFQKSIRKNFNFKSCKELKDTILISEDGVSFHVHRSVLSQSSVYFKTMFSLGKWSEGNSSKVVLQVHSKFLTFIIDYAYCKSLPSTLSEDPETVINILFLADQFLMPSLVSGCKSVLLGCLTIKNALEIAELTLMHDSLKDFTVCALTFICQNLGHFFESGALSGLGHEFLDEITELYKTITFSPQIRNIRSMKPLDTDNFSDIELKESNCKFISTNIFENISILDSRRKIRKKKSSPLKKQMKEYLVTDDSFNDVPNSSINEHNIDGKINSPLVETKTELKKILSQKQSKKNMTLSEPKNMHSKWTGWNLEKNESVSNESHPLSLNDVVGSKKRKGCKMLRVNKSSWKSLSFSDPQNTKECPWHQCQESLQPSTPIDSLNFQAILKDEEKKVQNTERMRNKSLRVTQIEEKAILDLLAFYGAEIISDENIYVERVLNPNISMVEMIWHKS